MNEKQRIHVLFCGQVQGVGFRFVTERIANKLGLVGFVRNLPDGKVEVICEGNVAILNDFINEIKDTMSGYISDSIVDWDNVRGEFSLFEIRFF